MALGNILGKKEEKGADKDAEVQKLREKFQDIVNTPEAKANPQAGGAQAPSAQPAQAPAQAPQGQNQYDYIDPERAEENERITNLIMQQIKELIEIDNNLNAKNKELENKIGENASTLASTKNMVDQFNSRLELIEKNMEKFMGLYEVVTNRFNPFVSEEGGDGLGKEGEAASGLKAPTESKPEEKPGEPKPEESKKEPGGKVPDSVPAANPAQVEKEVKDIIEQTDVSKLEKGQETIVEDELKEAVEEIGVDKAEKSKEELAKDINETVDKQVKEALAHHAKVTNDQLKDALHKMMAEAVQHITETVKDSAKPAEPVTAQPAKPTGDELHPDFHFKLPDGTEIKSVNGLKDALKTLDEAHFKEHVNDEKNDFAEWLRVVLDNDEVADKVAKEKTRDGILKILQDIN